MRRLLPILAALTALAPCGRPAAAACDPASSPMPRVVGYFTSWGIYARDFQVEDIDAEKLTHVQYAFANIDGATGTVVLGDPWADVDRPGPGDCWDPGCLRGNFKRFEELKRRHPHLKVMISVGGWTWSEHFSDVALTDASRGVFAASVVDLFIRGNLGAPWGSHPGIFDGVDIDWEYPVGGGMFGGRPEDRRNFTLLLQELRRQLDAEGVATGRRYELSIASGVSPQRLANLELPEISASLDYLGLMTYDFHGSWDASTNFNAPLFASSADPSPDPAGSCAAGAVANALAGGVPAQKLVLGVPFYGRSWTGVGGGGDGLYQPAAGAGPGTWEPGILDYWDVASTRVPVMTRHWHPESAVPWLFDGTTFITHDDPESMRAKAAHAASQGLGGVLIWELSGDVRGVPAPPDSLLATIVDALCPDAVAPGPVRDLRMSRDGGDLLFRWSLDAGAAGGYRLYETDARAESGSLRTPAHAPFLSVPASPSFPVVRAGGVASGLTYYQVLGVAADGATEGIN